MRAPKESSLFNSVDKKIQKIAKKLGLTDATVSRWRQKPLWIEFEQELLAVEKKAVLNAQLKTAEVEASAQG